MARGKRLVTLDVSKAAAREIALALIGRSDVVVENFKPGTLERWGYDPIALQEQFPQVVWVRVSGFGQTGPYRERGGYACLQERQAISAAASDWLQRNDQLLEGCTHVMVAYVVPRQEDGSANAGRATAA